MPDMAAATILTPVILATNTPRPIITTPITPILRVTITIPIPKDTKSVMNTGTMSTGRLVDRFIREVPKAMGLGPSTTSS